MGQNKLLLFDLVTDFAPLCLTRQPLHLQHTSQEYCNGTEILTPGHLICGPLCCVFAVVRSYIYQVDHKKNKAETALLVSITWHLIQHDDVLLMFNLSLLGEYVD